MDLPAEDRLHYWLKSGNLKQHIEERHLPEFKWPTKQLICGCTQTFDNERGLRYHLHDIHGLNKAIWQNPKNVSARWKVKQLQQRQSWGALRKLAFTAIHLRVTNMNSNCQTAYSSPFPHCIRSSRNIRSNTSIRVSKTIQMKAAEAAQLFLAFPNRVHHAVRFQQLLVWRNLLIRGSLSPLRLIKNRGLHLAIKSDGGNQET
jgi:hypothetical protein